MVDKEGREAELLELQKAEEAHRELLLKDRDERNKIAKDLHSLRRCVDGACPLVSPTRCSSACSLPETVYHALEV